MSCCAPSVEATMALARRSRDEIALASRDLGDGLRQTSLSVPDLHCGACVRTVESTLAQLAGVVCARANLTARRVSVTWRGENAPDIIEALVAAGYKSHPSETDDCAQDRELSRLLRALAVAAFCAMNIMMLSVSIWFGADAETRQAFHWISAGLALPALVYSGSVFYQSAWRVLRHGRTNMDVPISIGVTLAFGLSVYDTLHNGPHAYFDAAVTLIFFLLIGRILDHVMRERARGAVRSLMRLAPHGTVVERMDGSRDYLPVGEIEPGMTVCLSSGDRIPVDGRIIEGTSNLDCSVATGESMPIAIGIGSVVQAGALNLTGPLKLEVTARAQDSFLAQMTCLMEAAEGGRARYRHVADRASALYSPVVHAAALLTFLGWIAATGDWHRAISIAIAVLIITCPCALGLAVPIVQVVAARRLFDAGIMMKDGSAIERLDEIDTVAFDKTGTLTIGTPCLDVRDIPADILAIAAALARTSRHPVSQAIALVTSSADLRKLHLMAVTEQPGLGIEAWIDGYRYRLGRASWALNVAGRAEDGTVLTRDNREIARFEIRETLRPGAAEAVSRLKANGLIVELLSGDREGAVAEVARSLGIDQFAAGLMPGDKVARLQQADAARRRVLMVGDGLNDAPALSAAHVSMAPATAADIGRNAADFVFLRDSLEAIPLAVDISHRAARLVGQNFGIAVAYNALAMPVAIAGYVTPLIAALAMSVSSVIVVVNASRLRATSSLRKSGEMFERPRMVAAE